MAQEKSDANECITSIVKIRYNDASISFTTDNSVYFLHFFHHIYFSYRRRKVFTTMPERNFFQGLRATHVADRIAFLLAKDVVGYSYQRILFAKKTSILVYKT